MTFATHIYASPKNVILAFLTVALWATPQTNKRKTSWDAMGLKGKVKTLTEIVMKPSYLFGELAFTTNDIRVYSFSETGNETGHTWSNILIGKRLEINHRYSEEGQRTTTVQYDKSSSFRPEMTVFKYDTKGHLEEEAEYKADGSLSRKMIFKHNERGYKTEEASYGADGSLVPRWRDWAKRAFSYDTNGNMTEFATYSADGELLRKAVYKYDKTGHALESLVYNGDGALKSRSTTQYDAQGKQTNSFTYTADGAIKSRSAYMYDESGKPLEEMDFAADGSLRSKTTYKLDAHGNVLEETEYKMAFKFGKTNEEITRHVRRTYEYFE